jgi:DNA (cytosine-5)-methyltransferase 1
MTVGLGYRHRILSHNAMHHGIAQSRDRIFVVFWRPGLNPDLELELDAWCPRCADARIVRQSWKNGRSVGRYRQQWVWSCTSCGAVCEPSTEPAASIIDWSLPTPRIGDRERPLADATRSRIAAGLARYGWLTAVTTSGAGNTHERTPGNRARPVSEPVAVQQTTLSSALATPPGFQVQVAHGKDSPSRTRRFDEPAFGASASDVQGLVLTNRIHATPKPVEVPMTTVVAGGNHHALIVRSNGFVGSGDMGRFSSTPERPLPTVVTSQRPALIMRNNPGGAEMVTPVSEPVRTLTTKGHQSLLVPYYSNGQASSSDEPAPTMRTKDTVALVDPDEAVDDCGFRMFEPYEVAAAQGFPVGYIPRDLTKAVQVKLAGNAVPPAMMTWIAGRLLQALEAAAA